MGVLAVAVVGLALFGTGVRGLTQVDDQLASSTERPAVHQVRQELEVRGDCPWGNGGDQRRL
jgi:hypothetical protein